MSDQPSLDRLIARLSSLIGAATEALEQGQGTPDDWYNEVARQIRRYTMAAYASGDTSGRDVPRKIVKAYVDTQLEYLSAFRDEIKAADEWQNGWAARAQMYAQSIKAPWWEGHTRGWALPAMPGDGTTTCLTNCRCSWRIDELEGSGNADAYWVVSDGERCQTCIERGSQWSPLRIRDGVLL